MGFIEKQQAVYVSVDKDNGAFKVYEGKDENGEKKYRTPAPTRYKGTLIDISESEYEYKGRPTKKLLFKFKDDEEVTIFQFGMANYIKGFLNSMCSVDISKPVDLSIGIHNEFLNIWVNQGDDKFDWKYQMPKKADGEEAFTKWVADRVEEIKAKFPEKAAEIAKEIFEGEDIPTDLPF